jgi:hypothetical protein
VTRPILTALAMMASIVSGGSIHGDESLVPSAAARPSHRQDVVEGTSGMGIQVSEKTPVTFGPGQHRVGSDLAPGRYFARPTSGCYWERRSSSAAAAFGFIAFEAIQWIVEIHATDVAFHVNEPCGMWTSVVDEPLQTAIRPGMWLVGQQVRAGTYSSAGAAGCYWERLADFTGAASAVVARGLSSHSGTEYVTIFPSDAGFRTDAACGTWRPVAPRPPTLRIVN